MVRLFVMNNLYELKSVLKFTAAVFALHMKKDIPRRLIWEEQDTTECFRKSSKETWAVCHFGQDVTFQLHLWRALFNHSAILLHDRKETDADSPPNVKKERNFSGNKFVWLIAVVTMQNCFWTRRTRMIEIVERHDCTQHGNYRQNCNSPCTRSKWWKDSPSFFKKTCQTVLFFFELNNQIQILATKQKPIRCCCSLIGNGVLSKAKT